MGYAISVFSSFGIRARIGVDIGCWLQARSQWLMQLDSKR